MEFVQCLSEINSVIEQNCVEAVYVLGDFNANLGEPFFTELSLFCAEQNLINADISALGIDSDSFTYASEAHAGSRSWSDHCLVSETAWKPVTTVRINYSVFWSDHFPLE